MTHFILKHLKNLSGLIVWACSASAVWSAVALPSVFTNHMVLQRDMPIPVWGWADAGESITVALGDQTRTTTANDAGEWRVDFDAMQGSHQPTSLVVEGTNRVSVDDVLIGEVWICSGQSNMQWSVNATWNADLTSLSADRPEIRFLTIDNAGVQKPVQDFVGQWQVCSPETVREFSAVGYFFGLQLHEILDVPVGLIDNAWGGSSCEAWVERELLEQNPEQYAPLLAGWTDKEAQDDLRRPYETYEAALLQWERDQIAAKQAGERVPQQPERPRSEMVTQHRPGNLFNGRVEPIIPFAIRGVIWYQGESNAGRAYQYRHLFPLMIQNWRDAWKQGDFPFYWVQLADFMPEKEEPSESAWAELREAQSMTQDQLPNTGEAVIIDIGEASDIHPRNKREVGNRLARLALALDYGIDVPCHSPRYESMNVNDGKAVLTFRDTAGGLRTVDARQVQGFTIAGQDKRWRHARATIADDGKTIEVWHDEIDQPVAVRYAWADNPVCNVYSREGLPLTPFRTDDWPGVTVDNRSR